MSSSTLRQPPSPLHEPPVDPDVRKAEIENVMKTVRMYERIRVPLHDRKKKGAHEKAMRVWDGHVQKSTWTNHGHIDRRFEEDYLRAKVGLDRLGNNSKESETVGFIERWLGSKFSEARFHIKSQYGIFPKKGPEEQSDNMLGYLNIHMLEQPLVVIEAKPPEEDREEMTPAKLVKMENQAERYCREWLKHNPDVPFIYAITFRSTNFRMWVMARKRDMEKAEMVGLWQPKKRTWDEYRDPGLDCDAETIKVAISLIKEHPNGSDYALTTTSDPQSQSDQAPSAVPIRATRGKSGSRRGTPSGDSKGERNRSRDRRNNKSDDQFSSQEETSEQRAERHRKRDRERERAKESERSEGKNKEKERGEGRETSIKARSLQPSAPVDVPRSSSRVPRRSNTSTSERGNLASSSSPEYSAQTPIPTRERRERGDTDRAERSSTRDGKRPEGSSNSKLSEPKKRDFQARRTDSLSTVPPTSSNDRNTSSSDNREPRPKSTKKVGDASADARRKSKREKSSIS
ncbi:uncharacterized protein EAE97_008285 [Botrytis byssoidea]|uniref:Uncharacterized protein n=1 Tax=Botrytis byssoidea TaxID=139641 RepID=A0A9P5IIT4_9HELO|nr:uncharacterized protein EAE97_008285 [Botrytis byssoidea]KAF7935378.1 hypothetical protein EAE97_008285 [Botrytis byssoidea]